MPDNLKAKLIDLLDILERNAFPVEEYDIKKLRGLESTYRNSSPQICIPKIIKPEQLGEPPLAYTRDFLLH